MEGNEKERGEVKMWVGWMEGGREEWDILG